MQWELLILSGRDETPGWCRQRKVWTVTVPGAELTEEALGWLRMGSSEIQLEFAFVLPFSCWGTSQGTAQAGEKFLAPRGKSV